MPAGPNPGKSISATLIPAEKAAQQAASSLGNFRNAWRTTF